MNNNTELSKNVRELEKTGKTFVRFEICFEFMMICASAVAREIVRDAHTKDIIGQWFVA